MANEYQARMEEHDRLYQKAAALDTYNLSDFIAVSDFPITLWLIYFTDPATEKRSTGYVMYPRCANHTQFEVYDTLWKPREKRVFLFNNTDDIAFERLDIDTPADIPFQWLDNVEVDLDGAEWYNVVHPSGVSGRFLRSAPNHTARVTVGNRVPQKAIDFLVEAAAMNRCDD